MKAKTFWLPVCLLCASITWQPSSSKAQPVISSFSQNGVLTCTNLQPGTVASVEWASSLSGPWTNWAGAAGLDAVNLYSNKAITVSVPMFYRVRGVVQTTNSPAGMVLIPAGSFTMGDNLDGDSAALPLHTNNISAFYMDQYVVTKAQWDSVYQWANTHGYSFDNAGSGKATNHPVQTVSWYDCVKWCNARSELEGKTPAYYTSAAQTMVYRAGAVAVDNSSVKWNYGYRLPTEAEWEKAARGGASGQRYPWGNTISESQANYSASPASFSYDLGPYTGNNTNFTSGGSPYTSPVDYFAPNGYGLYDMTGNVWQWCWDWYGSYGSGSQTDPRGATSGSDRVYRDGSWFGNANWCRTAFRGGYSAPTIHNNTLGFRCVLPPSQ